MDKEIMEESKAQHSHIHMLNINIDNLSKEETIEKINNLVENRGHSHVVGVNIDQALMVNRNTYSKEIFDCADIVFVDGKPITWIAKMYKSSIKERITGPDLMIDVCQLAEEKGYKVFLLGAATGVAKSAAEKLCKKFPKLKVTGTYSPPFGFEKDEVELHKINEMLKESKSDILFVGMGSPKQDIFIYENKDKYEIPLSFSMGAAIDFIAGNIKRAPRWMINCGLEWFHRFLQDPKRLFKRYFITSFSIIPIIYNDLKEKQNRSANGQ